MKAGKRLRVLTSLVLVCVFLLNSFFVHGAGYVDAEDVEASKIQLESAILGEIQSPKGVSAEDIRVLLYDMEDYTADEPETALYEIFTDEEGLFEAENLSAGVYRLEFYFDEDDFRAAQYEMAPASEDVDYKIENVQDKDFFAFSEFELEEGQEYTLTFILQAIEAEEIDVETEDTVSKEPEDEITEDLIGTESEDETVEETIETESEDGMTEEIIEIEAEDETDGAIIETGSEEEGDDQENEQEMVEESGQAPLTVEELTNLDFDSAAAALEQKKLNLFERLANAIMGTNWTYDAYYIGENDKYYTEKTDDFSLKYQMEFHTSVSLKSEEVEIRIPAALFIDRNGSKILPEEVAVPMGTKDNPTSSNTSPFNYYMDEETEELVFFNYKAIRAGTNAAFQVLYKNVKVMQVKDGSTWKLEPVISVTDTENGGVTETKTGTALTGAVDSEVILAKVSKTPYNYSGDSYTPGLYTPSQVEKYISGSLPAKYTDNFDDYVFVVWQISVTGSATQPWNMRIRDITDNSGEVVGYSGNIDKSNWSEDNSYITGIQQSQSKNINQSFYVVTAYSAANVAEGNIIKNAVDILLEPVDGLDPNQTGRAEAEWSYKYYEWVYEGDWTQIRKSASSGTSKGWLEVYKAAAAGGEDMEVPSYAVKSTVNGYGMTHETTTGNTLGRRIPDASYQVTTVDDILYASSSDNASDLRMLGEDDYYFSEVKIKQTDYGYDPWEDIYAAPEDTGALIIYAWYAGGMDWEEVARIPWSEWKGSGTNKTAQYTFTEAELAGQPWRVKAVHESVNFKTECSIDVTVKVRHDSPVFDELLNNSSGAATIDVQNISGVMTEEMLNGEWQNYVHSTETDNYDQYPSDLLPETNRLYGVALQRDSAQVKVSGLSERSASTKTAVASNDVENGRVQVKYTLTASDGYELYAQDGVRYLVAAGLPSPGRKEVVFYDLLPYGVQLDPSVTITAGRTTGSSQNISSTWDTSQVQVSVDSASDVIHNYKGTGRTLVAFHISYDGAESAFFRNGMWMEGWGISFGAYYEWKDIDIVSRTPNISAFMAEAGDDRPLLGSEYKNDGGFPAVAGNPNLYEDFGSNIGELGTGRSVLYAWSPAESNVIMSATSEIEKLVRADADGYSAFEKSTAVDYDAGYTYEISIVNAVGILKDIVIFDRLENAAKDRNGKEGERPFEAEYWYGTFVGIQTRVLDELGIDYVIYYNADREAILPVQGSGMTPEEVLTQANGWYTQMEWLNPTEDVCAIAIDLKDFRLGKMESLSVQIQMQSPDIDPGAVYAYNNPSFYSQEEETGTAEMVEGDSVRVELSEGSRVEVEKRFSGEIPETVAATKFAFSAYRKSEGESPVKWANREYYLCQWNEASQEWERVAGLYATDRNGIFYLSNGQRAVFLNVPAGDRLIIEEEENFYWRVSEEEEILDNGRRIIFINEYQPVLYVQKKLMYAPEGADLSGYSFEFQLMINDEPLADTEYWYVDRVRTDGGAAGKIMEKGIGGVGRTDANGIFNIQDGDIIALPALIPGAAYTLKEVSGAGESDDWFCIEDTITGTIPVLGESAVITNYYRWKDLYLTKTIINQNRGYETVEFTFRVTDEDGGAVSGNTWVLFKDGAEKERGILEPDGTFTSACGGGVVRIEGLEAGKTYLIEETDSGTMYEALNGGLAEVTMPKYGTGGTAEITNDYCKRSLSVSKIVLYDEADLQEVQIVKNREFEMTVEIDGRLLTDTRYMLYENNKYVRTDVTDSSGKLTLKNGQTAVFDEVGEKGQSYKVTETKDDNYPQIFPVDKEAHEGFLNQKTTALTFINGDSNGMLMIRKEYTGEDSAAELLAEAYQTDTELRKEASVTLTLEITPENGSAYIWPQADTDVTVIDNTNGSSEIKRWAAGSPIVLAPWKTVYVEGLADTDTYKVYESGTDKHRLTEWPADSGNWFEISQKTPVSDQAVTGSVAESPLAVIINGITTVETQGSRIHKEMTADSEDVPTGAKLVWRLEEYDGKVWSPKAGITYFITDDEKAVSGRTLTTGTDGLIVLQKNDAGYPAVQFTDAQVQINYYEGIADGDLRLVEVLSESDSEWGWLSGYVNDSGNSGLDIKAENAVGFVNSNMVIGVEIEKKLEDGEDTNASFTFILEQIISAAADPVTDRSQITATEVRGGIFYTIHDSETKALVGEGRTTAKGEIMIRAGQYAKLQLPNHTLWTVREQAVLPYQLERMSGEAADELTKLDDNLMLLQMDEAEVVYEPIALTQEMVNSGVRDINNNLISFKNGAVVVPDKIIDENNDVRVITSIASSTSGSKGAFYDVRLTLTSVVLPDTLTFVGDYSFYYCSYLTEIEMPAVKSIGNNAFYSCRSLEEIDMPMAESVGTAAFYSCSSLVEINMPKVESLGMSTFRICSSLVEVNMPKVNSIGDYAFATTAADGSSLLKIKAPELRTVGNNAFQYCTSLEEIDMPKAETVGNYAFQYCNSLEDVNLPAAERIGTYAFATSAQHGSNLTKVNMPKAETIENYAFYYCSNLKAINAPKVRTIGTSAFRHCGSLEEVLLPEVESVGPSAFTTDATYGSSLKKAEMPNVKTIGDYAFQYCGSLEDLIMPEVVTIGISAFATTASTGSSLTKVSIPKAETIKISAFSNQTKLEEVEMLKVEAIESRAFQYCSSLKEAIMPEVKIIGDYAFATTTTLGSSLVKAEMPKVETIGEYAFQYCTKLEELDLPEAKTIGKSAFASSSSSYMHLREISIPKVQTIGDSAFRYNDALPVIYIPNTTVSIGSYAFGNCTALTDINIDRANDGTLTGSPWGAPSSTCSVNWDIQYPTN